ncbi:uncharacterized protein [Triticum aestivum]|uniref:uncharacterized protein n=1 Tax=Triticum aestivum TaxID=4565 RepID=UPI001D00440E|nr:uncharacterized protein LOC123171524 [Triticum aestivum]
MAEFALGLTKTAVEGTLSRVKSAIEEEGKQRARVQEDLMFITSEFEMMQAFLSASSAGERASNNLVAWAWVRQLRRLAFDVEDCVEFVVHLDEPSPWDWVQRLASSLPCLARPPLPLDEAVAEIKRLKARVEEVSQRNTRYNIMAGGGDNGDENKQMIKRPAAGGHTHTSAPGAEAFHVLRDVWKAMGKAHEATVDLKRLIDCQGSELKVISLWGSPEADVAGELEWASSFVKNAYVDPEICQQFKNRACVKLASPFNPAEFLNNLLTQFTSHHHNRHDDMSELMLQVSQHKYLIILEQELSSVADWEAIKMYLPDGNNGSRIIVSTKHLAIARLCTGEPFQVCEFHCFSRDQYLCAIFPKGCAHRIGMAEFVWQLRRHPGVISLCSHTFRSESQLIDELHEESTGKLRVFDGLKFEYQYYHPDDELNLVEFAMGILEECYPEDTPECVFEEMFSGMDDQDKIQSCREFLTQHDYLIYVKLELLKDWDFIRQHLLCESTRACIVVITGNQSVAKHCVGHQQYLSLNVHDLLNEEEGEHEPDELVGREDESDFFRGHSQFITVSSVWGIAGVGKSAIVRPYYNYIKLNREHYRTYGWVDVAHPFSLMDMCRRLLLDFYSDDLDAKETAAIGMVEGQDPIQTCCKILREKKCLLVIDDLRSTHEWDLIKASLLSQAKIGYRIIVITREESIARHCTVTIHNKYGILNLKGLEPDMALHLFKKITLDGKPESEFPPNAEKISKLITSKCGSIPEVIVAIGKIASLGLGNIEWLEHINVDFMRVLDTPSSSSSLKGLFCWMQSYFDACSDELKPCIFYMSIFPAEQRIRRRRLLRRWIAEGYSSCGGGGGIAEEKAEKLLADFMKLGIFYKGQISSTTRSCQLNGFFHEYIKSRPMEDNLVFELQGSCGPSSRLTGQHLTISSSWDRDEIVFNSMDLSRLRSLTVFGKWVPFIISCDKMKMLRVLDLEDTSSSSPLESDDTGVVTDDDLEMIGKFLTRLKFLSLRGCMQVTHLPDSMGAMRQLETLDVRHTSIFELPPAIITKLHKLQYIRAGNTATRSPLAPTPPPSPTLPPLSLTQPEPVEQVHGGTSPFLGAKAAALCVTQQASARINGAWKSRAHALVESSNSSSSWWESRKQRRSRVAANGGGVEVACAAAKGIGKLTELHTLGVVNIAGGRGALLLFLKALKKLTQLRKLGLSGINRKNWKDLCSAISGHLPHLESLSLQLLLLEEDGSYDFACFDDISELPKTLKSLKVFYTGTGGGAGASPASISAAWINQFPNLKRFNHEVRVSSQDDMNSIRRRCHKFANLNYSENELHVPGFERRLGIKPSQQHISFGDHFAMLVLDSLVIYCSGISSTVTVGRPTTVHVKAVSIRCCSSCGGSSCLRIDGLERIRYLKEVFVTGPCSDGFKEELQKQLNKHQGKPSLRLL